MRGRVKSWWVQLDDFFVNNVMLPSFLLVLYLRKGWNRRKECKAIEEGKQVVMEIQDPSDTIDPTRNGKLVHITGFVKCNNDDYNNNNFKKQDTIMGDLEFGVLNVPGIIRLQRHVEMYEQVEQPDGTEVAKNKRDSKATAEIKHRTFEKQWVLNFEEDLPFQLNDWNATSLSLGEYKLSTSDVISRMLLRSVPLDNYPFSVDTIPSKTKQLVHPLPIQVYVGNKNQHGYYIGHNSDKPELGDIRITYYVLPERTISILGKQEDDGSISTYTGKSGGTILLVRPGIHTVTEMLQHATNVCTKRHDMSISLGFRRRDLIPGIIAHIIIFIEGLSNQRWFAASFIIGTVSSFLFYNIMYQSEYEKFEKNGSRYSGACNMTSSHELVFVLMVGKNLQIIYGTFIIIWLIKYGLYYLPLGVEIITNLGGKQFK